MLKPLLFLTIICLLIQEGLAMEPPDAIKESKRRAMYHFTLAIDDISASQVSTTGGVDHCQVAGLVEKIHRKPLFKFKQINGAPVSAAPFTVIVHCWNELKQPDPPGPNRLYYGGPTRHKRIEIWGSVIEEEFVTFVFEEID